MHSKRSNKEIWSGWLGKVSHKEKKWGRKPRFFKLLHFAVPGDQPLYKLVYFVNNDDPYADRKGTINLFNAAGDVSMW